MVRFTLGHLTAANYVSAYDYVDFCNAKLKSEERKVKESLTSRDQFCRLVWISGNTTQLCHRVKPTSYVDPRPAPEKKRVCSSAKGKAQSGKGEDVYHTTGVLADFQEENQNRSVNACFFFSERIANTYKSNRRHKGSPLRRSEPDSTSSCGASVLFLMSWLSRLQFRDQRLLSCLRAAL